MKEKFLVKIPVNPDDVKEGYLEVKFKTYKEISDYLQVGIHAVRAIAEGTAKFTFDKTKHLQDIKIERLEPPKQNNQPKTDDERKEYLKALREKALLLKSSQ